MVELNPCDLLHEVWGEPMMEFYKRYKRFDATFWVDWGLGIGGYVRLQKRDFQIQLNLVFVEFYLDLYLLRKGSHDPR
jgi:hypothetical protein